MKIEVDHHAGVAIIEEENTRELLLGVYDESYPHINDRGKVKLIGGNYCLDDISPWHIYCREISEEFCIIEKEKEKFASEEDIKFIRERILKVTPYQDFLVSVPKIANKSERNVIYSVYNSRLSNEAFAKIRDNLNAGRKIINEGYLRITSIDELIQGNPLTAGGTGLILENYFNVKIPNLDGVKAEIIGKPRDNFIKYLDDFCYTNPTRY